MIAALSLTKIYPGFSPGNKVHKYYFRVWTLSGLRVWIFFELSSLGRLAMSTEVLGTQTLNTQTEEGERSLPAENGSRGAP
jgi:hypothetical protein